MLHGGSGGVTVLLPVAQSFGIESHRIDRTPEHVAATFQVSAPEPSNFSRPVEWNKWIRHFECFRVASGLNEKGEAAQVNTLIYSMGDEADDILRCFTTLSAEDKTKYAPLR